MPTQDHSPSKIGDETHKSGKQGSGSPITARGEATRRRILDAAEEVFGEYGYYEASISEITRRAGVAQGTFYIYFRTKREIFAELVEDIGKRLRASMRSATRSIADRTEVERYGFKTFFEFVATHRRIYSVLQEAERVAPEAAHAYYDGLARGYTHRLNEAMDAGTIRSVDAEAIAYALMGIGHFVALRWLVWSQQDDTRPDDMPPLPDSVMDSVLDFIMSGLK